MELNKKKKFDYSEPITNYKARIYIIGIIIISIIIMTFLVGIYFGIIYTIQINDFYDKFPQKFDDIPHYFQGKFFNSEKMYIDIKFLDYTKLKEKRDEALQKGILIKSGDDEVPATITYKDKSVKVNLRLKGDWVVDHLTGNKWSFRINAKGDNAIMGMEEFSLHRPEARHYIYEWLFHRALKKEGLIGLRYSFLTVILNGDSLGTYALEEHFTKQLLESNNRREAPIISFNENRIWQIRDEMPFFISQNNELEIEDETFLSSEIDSYSTKKVNEDPEFRNQYLMAKDLLESFRIGRLEASDAFDSEKYAKFLALTDLFGAWHGQVYTNMKFYYNPITSKLEPIGFDASTGEKISGLIINPQNPLITEKFIELLFKDSEFTEQYIEELEILSQKEYLDDFFSEIDKELQDNLKIIYRETPSFDFSKEIFYKNQEVIQEMLNPKLAILPYFEKYENSILTLKIGNFHALPIEIQDIFIEDKKLKPISREIFEGKKDGEIINFKKIEFNIPNEYNLDVSEESIKEIQINYKILGAQKIFSRKVIQWKYLDTNSFEEDIFRKKSNAENFGFLIIDHDKKLISVRPGTWTLDKDLILPTDFTFKINEGTNLVVINNARIVSYSPLRFISIKDNPILIDFNKGKGVLVLNANRETILENVIFDGLPDPSGVGIGLTGAITFYESPVLINNVAFINGKAEDSLNIIRSNFTISSTLVKGASSDCIDIDFSNGVIRDSTFEQCTNDGVDFSGSKVKINNIKIDKAGDKAISIGELSEVNAEGISIYNSNIGIAVKDNSNVEMNNLQVSNTKFGVSLYQKKPEFGPASAKITSIDMEEVEIPYFIEHGSLLYVDGKEIKERISRKELVEYSFDGITT